MNDHSVSRARRALCVGLAAAPGLLRVSAAKAAAPDHSYAVISLVADKMTLVSFQTAIGSNLNRNEHRELALPDRSLERDALVMVDGAIRKAQPDAEVALFAPKDPALYAGQSSLYDSEAQARSFAQTLGKLLDGEPARRLLLLSKHRGESRMRLVDGTTGAGTLTGLGFYIDRVARLKNVDTGVSSFGYIAPYAYLRATLYDLPSMAELGTSTSSIGYIYPTSQSKDALNPWDALTVEQKVEVLRGAMGKAIDATVPKVLAAG